MKKITILAAVVALLGSCAQNTEDTIKPNAKVEGRTIYATFDNEEEETKNYVENYKYLRWHAGDEISFFDATTHNSQYAFAGNNGDAEGEFNAVATGEGTAIATTYGVYPYNANTSISEEGVISVELPAIQAYGVNSFGRGANTMVAVGESATDDKLFFKNACGYLVVKLYNENGAAVKSVVLEGNNEEKISGAATITATYAGIPSVTMADTAPTSVTIDCGEGVEIGTTAETATEFWFALPEITFEGGITITATDTEGKEYEKTTPKPVVITRNNVQPMKALEAEFVVPTPKPANNEIWYTATEKVTPNATNVFGANIVSNEWNYLTLEGVITFDGDVTKIGTDAFWSCSRLASITIPEGVTSIGNYAFEDCSSLASVTILEGVTSIGSRAFCYCTSLTSITIPDSVTSIGSDAFSHCTSLASVTIGNGVTIRKPAFSGCESLAEFNGKYASEDGRCLIVDGVLNSFAPYGLTEYSIPEGVTSIGEIAFQGYSSLESISIPDSVTSIRDYAFRGCSSLESITLPDSVTSIGYSAFYGCSSLASITIPEGVTSIGDEAFSGCTSLAEFEGKFASEDGRCLIIDGVLNSFAPYGLTEYAIPKGVTSIGDYAFYGCPSLASLTIGSGVTSTGSYAFADCTSLASVTIGSGVTSIGFCAFDGCSSLAEVYCKPTTPPSGDYYMFDNNASGRKIYVPAGSVSAYKNARYWSNYKSYIYGYNF